MLTLSVNHVGVSFSEKMILNDICATFHAGETIAVIGRNGAGKTTFLKALANLLPPRGTVNLQDGDYRFSRKDIAYVSQLGNVSSRLTVFEIVLLGLSGDLGWKVSEDQLFKVDHVLKELNLTSLSDHPMEALSGGQKQLVFMAQALVSRPRVLLLDEPTSALDLRHQLVVMDLATQYTTDHGAITIFVVHDLMLASRYGSRLFLLDGGNVRRCDAPESVLIPGVLSDVYQVDVSVERSRSGFLQVIPLRPLAPGNPGIAEKRRSA